MLELFKNLFAWQPFLPHGHCYLWKPGLVGLHIVSDSIIALAYYSIPITLLYFVRKRQDLPYSWMFLLFSAFIIACGTTHLMEIWTLWYPTYWLSGCLKAITAFVSFLTAVEMLQLVPKALALPSPAQIETTNQELEREIGERKLAEAALKQARNELEVRVKERTAQLAKANKELQHEISDRKQAQSALQASEARLKEVLDNTGAFISSARIHPDKPWEYDYYSPNGEDIFGYKGEEFAADPSLWFSRIHAEDIETIILPVMEDLYAGRQITIEYRFRHKNGSWRWLSNTLLAKKHESEDYWFLTGIVIGITQRKQAEKALQESEQRFAALAKTAPVGIFRTDLQGNWVYGNERSFEMSGLCFEELIGAGWATAIHPDDHDRTRAAWLSFVQQGIPYHYEYRFQRPDGSAIWVLGQAIAEKDVDGNIIGYIGTITEITERKQAEKLLKDYNQVLEAQVKERTAELSRMNTCLEQEIEERKQIEAQLRRSEAKLSIILDNAGACIYIKDLNATYTYVNRLTVELFGRSESEIIGANDRDFFAKELALTYRKNNDQVIKTGVVHRFEEVGIDCNGELHNYLSTKVPLKNSDGDIYAICGISTDITEIKKAEAALRQSEERMQALLSAIPDLMFRHRVDGTYLDVAGNDKSLLIPREALIGNKLQDTPIPEPIKAGLLKRFQAAVATGTLQIYEHDLEKPDGMYSYETRIMKSSADEVVCLVRDVTERKRWQVALQESEERYRTVVAAMAEGIVLQDADGVIHTCNASAKRILGLSRKQMMGRTSLDPGWRAVHEDGSPFPAQERPSMVTLRTGKPCSNVVMGVHKPDSSFTWISINCRPLFRACEPLPYAVVTSFADITARKQAEAALRQSEARYLAILEDQTELIGRALPDGTLTFVNEAFCRFYGKTREELVGYRYEPSVFEEDRERVARLLKTLSVNNPVVIIENRAIAKGQEVCWTQWVNRGIFDEEGQLLEFQGVGRDITDRKQAEEKLKQAEHKYRTLVEQIPGVVYISPIQATTEQAYISPQVQQLLEVSPEEWSPGFFNSWADYVHPEDRDRVLQAVSTAISTGEPLSAEYRMITRNGKTIWIRDRAHLVLCPGGQTQVLQGLAFDISDRKQMEQALQESNERFQLAASAVKGFIYDWDLKQNIVLRTQGLFEAVGYRPEEVEAKVDWWSEHVHPEDLPNVSQDLSAAFASETQNYYVLEYRLRHRDGHYVYLSDYGTIARDPDGQAIRAVGHAIDVSDRREAEAALQKALQAAQAASIAKSRFLSNMSHELRTPLNAILGFSQVMVRSDSLSADHKEQLKIINRSGEHLLNLINDILSMAKIEAGQTTLSENRFDLYLLLDNLEQMLKLKATFKGLQLIFERASDIPQYVQTDENKLRQVLINLLGNAIKFTSAGHVALRVKKGHVLEVRGQTIEKSHTRNLKNETCLLFEVEDTGSGIASDEIGTLFNPFIQTETGRKSMQGTGLGLPISRQFVQMMGGNITVSSQAAKGTIFRFDVLVSEVAGADEKSLSSTQRVIKLEPNQPTYRMLVVEDVEENRQLLLKLLEPLGFEVREAVNGEEAIALWSTWKPHLIWMDMRMPVMDGYEATREIKALEQQSAGTSPAGRTKIIALTASAFEEQQAKILAAGCDDFIHKPFRESLLFDKIAQHLGVRYIYEEDDQGDSPQLVAPRKLTPQDLSVMSPEWIAQLHQAILCADEPLILKLIEQIPAAEASLAHTLTDLLNNFRLDLLFDLTQELNHE